MRLCWDQGMFVSQIRAEICCWANLIGVDPTSIYRPSKTVILNILSNKSRIIPSQHITRILLTIL